MQSQLSSISVFLLATLATAQAPLEVSGFADTSEEPSWGQETEAEHVALRYDQQAGEHTIFLVHTCVDPSVAGAAIARGVGAALPFMRLPDPAWSSLSPELTALSATFDFGDPLEAEDLMIPPRRVANYLQQFVTSGYHADHGTFGGNGVNGYLLAPTDIVPPSGWQENHPADERIPLGAATWSPHLKVPFTFSAGAMGFDAVMQAAHEYHATIPGLPPLDAAALETLGRFLYQDLGFLMHVQALHVKPPGGGDPKVTVRFGRHVKLRRRDLAEIEENLFTTVVGKDAWVPWPIANDTMVHFGEYGGVLMFEFDAPVGFAGHLSTLTGYFPSESGWVTLPQLANPVDEFGEPARANVALFSCDAQILPGLAFFVMTSHPYDILPQDPVLMTPLHGVDGGALVLPYAATDPEPPSAL